MNIRFVLLACAITLIAGTLWFMNQSNTSPVITVQLTSAPFPLTVGRTTLQVLLSDADGTPIEDASLQVASTITQGGELTLFTDAVSGTDGQYSVPMTYPRMGKWTIEITGTRPNQQAAFYEQFTVFVYPILPFVQSIRTTYRSATETEAMTNANPTQEFWVVIPPGTDEMMMEGLAGDLIPNEIYLQASGRNTLVIRNDDFANHNIGPFYVRAGETIRQQFTEPAVYVGTCTISHSDEISIVVEA